MRLLRCWNHLAQHLAIATSKPLSNIRIIIIRIIVVIIIIIVLIIIIIIVEFALNLHSPPHLSFNHRPKFAVVVVKKRINTRLFAPDQRGQPSNPLPGTVVDDQVTKPDW